MDFNSKQKLQKNLSKSLEKGKINKKVKALLMSTAAVGTLIGGTALVNKTNVSAATTNSTQSASAAITKVANVQDNNLSTKAADHWMVNGKLVVEDGQCNLVYDPKTSTLTINPTDSGNKLSNTSVVKLLLKAGISEGLTSLKPDKIMTTIGSIEHSLSGVSDASQLKPILKEFMPEHLVISGPIQMASDELDTTDSTYRKIYGGKFSDLIFLKDIQGLNNLDTSAATDMSFMFAGDVSLKNIDLSKFDTSNVTNMKYMFAADTSLTSLDLSKFDTSKVTNMNKMFAADISLNDINFGNNFKTDKVENIADSMMFNETPKEARWNSDFGVDQPTTVPTEASQATVSSKGTLTVKVGGSVGEAKDAISGLPDDGSTAEWETPVDTSKEGLQIATVLVTFSDGSTKEVSVLVNVESKSANAPTEASQATVVSKGTLTVKVGDSVGAAKDAISGLPDDGSKAEWKVPVDTSKEGSQIATVVVTFSDGSTEQIPVLVEVKAASSNNGSNSNGSSGSNSGSSSNSSSASSNTTSAPATGSETTKSVIVMHNAYIYDKDHKRVGTKKIGSYTNTTVYGEKTKLNDGTEAYKVGEGQYIDAGNVDGYKVALNHNSYVYKTSKKRANHTKLLKGATVTVYGSSFTFKNGQKYYRIAKGQYIKVVNADIVK